MCGHGNLAFALPCPRPFTPVNRVVYPDEVRMRDQINDTSQPSLPDRRRSDMDQNFTVPFADLVGNSSCQLYYLFSPCGEPPWC